MITSNEFKNNLIYKLNYTDSLVYFGGSTGDDYKTVAEFNAVTGDKSFIISDNIGGDPLFEDDTNDTLSIGLGSPAINAGIGVGINLDMLGHVVSDAPDIGSIEYGAVDPDPPGLSIVVTVSASLSVRNGVASGNVTDDSGSTITARGICWNTSINPTTSNSKTVESGTTGAYTSTITGLTSSTTYHLRAYVTNAEAGTSYGADYEFTTPEYSPSVSNGKPAVSNGKPAIIH